MHVTPLMRVAEFHRAFNHPVAQRLTPATKSLRRLRVELIAEELKELAVAAGVPLTIYVGPEAECADDGGVNMIEVADALGDIEYVTLGAQLVFGIPGDAVNAEVHRANMSKLGADGKPIYRSDYKVLKGPNYTPPDIAGVLHRHRNANLDADLKLAHRCAKAADAVQDREDGETQLHCEYTKPLPL